MSKHKQDKFTKSTTLEKLCQAKPFIQVEGADTDGFYSLPIKQIVAGFDFDGKLSKGDGHSISEELQNYLIRLEKLGIKILFSSGKTWIFYEK